MNNNDFTLSIKNSFGKQVSLLNDTPVTPQFNINTINIKSAPKRKYHCTEIGCNKSFTTSGHLARHNRIHTGEKNFECLHSECSSRFSRQDNMMQHYRTHFSQKIRRQNQQLKKPAQAAPSPFYCHKQENFKLFGPITSPSRFVSNLPYPIYDSRQQERRVGRPKRALSTSSTCSSTSSSPISSPFLSPQCSHSPPFLYLHQLNKFYEPVELNQFSQQKSNKKLHSNILNMDSIFSTFG